ncbi:hypothetical protein DPMN_090345 [Dreissena polymorpha]|uniref:Uncharacterized protein n=1 Tax=Dreissena polymorpha TaxID=45954 RepID=A0A9D4QY90_DREPO|nr:hypothetical protein DPMN_090345 [Dreissena polymorpha]
MDIFNWQTLKTTDQNYRLVSHCPVPPIIHDICHVDSHQVAAVHSSKYMQKIQILTVGTGKLVKGMDHQLIHSCYGIAHHQCILYITSANALYQYTMTGTMVGKVYENTTNNDSVYQFE